MRRCIPLEPAAEAVCNQSATPPLIFQMRFPPTMIINGQADVLRSEGEAFGEKLRCAGVDVTALQVQGTIHDFVMLNALDRTSACRIAMDASTEWLKRCE
ncbi:MAG: alpha/beta hydrolase [Muribaculum sp.]|nr:alpha/beta hydrolase [Muribaculum sp.]